MADSSAPQFRRAVVALSGGRTDRKIVTLAADIARAGRAEIVGVHVVEIDWTLPLDADVAGHDESAQRVLDIAETTAEAAHYQMETVLLQARDVGAAIVDEATERAADVVILSTMYDNWFEPNTSMEPGSDEPNQVLEDEFCLVDSYGDNSASTGRTDAPIFELYVRCD